MPNKITWKIKGVPSLPLKNQCFTIHPHRFKNYFRHFDGAIHFYTENEYLSRRDSDFNYNSKTLQTDSHSKII